MIPYNRENLEWRPVVDYEKQYEVSNYGDFHVLPITFIDKANRKITRKEKFFWSEELKGYGGKNIQKQYLGIHLGGMKKTYAHILAARAFCDNPEQKKEVNHKDGNPKNNYCGCKKYEYRDSNLEWVTSKENMKHASLNGLINYHSVKRKMQCKKNREKIDYESFKKPILQLTLDGKLIKEYSSISAASKSVHISTSAIIAVAKKEKYRKTAGGYNWVYKQDYIPKEDYIVEIDQGSGTRKSVIKKTLSGQYIAEYPSIQDACKSNNFSGAGYISECCRGKRKHYKNFLWEYN